MILTENWSNENKKADKNNHSGIDPRPGGEDRCKFLSADKIRRISLWI